MQNEMKKMQDELKRKTVDVTAGGKLDILNEAEIPAIIYKVFRGQRQAGRTPPRPGTHPPAARRSQRTGVGHPHRGQALFIRYSGASA